MGKSSSNIAGASECSPTPAAGATWSSSRGGISDDAEDFGTSSRRRRPPGRGPAAPSTPHEAFERPPVGRAWWLTVEQRLAVVRYAETVGIKPASARFGLDRNTVRAWRARWRAEGLGGLVPRSPRRPRPTPGG